MFSIPTPDPLRPHGAIGKYTWDDVNFDTVADVGISAVWDSTGYCNNYKVFVNDKYLDWSTRDGGLVTKGQLKSWLRKVKLIDSPPENETLNPVFHIRVVDQYDDYYPMKYSKEYGRYRAVSLTEAQAHKHLKDLEDKGIGAYAYHSGFTTRGFRTGEPSCTMLAANKHYKIPS